MSDAVTTGLFALGGVLIGGVVNGAVTFAVQRRQQTGAVRAAARSAFVELFRAAISLGKAARAGDLDELASHGVETPRCVEHEAIFAANLSTRDYLRVSGAVAVVERTRDRWDQQIGLKLRVDEVEGLTQLSAEVGAAGALLLDVAEHGPTTNPLRLRLRALRRRLFRSRYERCALEISELSASHVV